MRSLLTVAAALLLGLGFVATAAAQDAEGKKKEEQKEAPKVASYTVVMEGMT
jgi:hypothetical protein